MTTGDLIKNPCGDCADGRCTMNCFPVETLPDPRHRVFDEAGIPLSDTYISQAVAHLDEGGRFSHRNAIDFLIEITRLRGSLYEHFPGERMRVEYPEVDTFAPHGIGRIGRSRGMPA